MSMYNVNTSIPKTLVRFLVRHVALHGQATSIRDVLLRIADDAAVTRTLTTKPPSHWLTEVVAVQPPGREARIAEPPFHDLAALVREMHRQLLPELRELPFALFGHSNGALMAFELARTRFPIAERYAHLADPDEPGASERYHRTIVADYEAVLAAVATAPRRVAGPVLLVPGDGVRQDLVEPIRFPQLEAVKELERRTMLPGTSITQIALVWTTVLLNIHRGHTP